MCTNKNFNTSSTFFELYLKGAVGAPTLKTFTEYISQRWLHLSNLSYIQTSAVHSVHGIYTRHETYTNWAIIRKVCKTPQSPVSTYLSLFVLFCLAVLELGEKKKVCANKTKQMYHCPRLLGFRLSRFLRHSVGCQCVDTVAEVLSEVALSVFSFWDSGTS